MNKHSRSKSSLFLMELIIVILFFAISAAICMSVFGTAKVKSDYSRDLSSASMAAQSFADTYKACDGNIQKTAELMKADLSGNTIRTYYNNDWKQLDAKNSAEYMLSLKVRKNSDFMSEAKIKVEKKNGGKLFELTVKAAHDKSE